MILIDEFHVLVFVPRGLRESEYRAIRRLLNSRRYPIDLSQAVRQVFRRYSALRGVCVRLSR
jgi:hypothetical protein